MPHYYDCQPEVESQPVLRAYQVGETTLNLWTDAGTFSKKGLDRGTAVLLAWLDEIRQQQPELAPQVGQRILDLGCGNGVIGLFCQTWFPGIHLTGCEVNHRASALAKRNADRLKTQFDWIEGLPESAAGLPPSQHYDWILSNPPIRIGKTALYALIHQAQACLKPQGHLVLVIGKKQGAASMEKHLSQTGTVERVARENGFWVLDWSPQLDPHE